MSRKLRTRTGASINFQSTAASLRTTSTSQTIEQAEVPKLPVLLAAGGFPKAERVPTAQNVPKAGGVANVEKVAY